MQRAIVGDCKVCGSAYPLVQVDGVLAGDDILKGTAASRLAGSFSLGRHCVCRYGEGGVSVER